MAECSTGCGQPTQDMLCSTCLTHLVTDLRQIQTRGQMPGLYEELMVTLTRQDKLTKAGDKVKGQGETALMFNAAASEVKWVLDNTISTWARDIAEMYPHRALTATSTAEAAAWMADGAGLLAEHPAAKELYDEITDVVKQVRRVIDRRESRMYLGPCKAVVDGVMCPEDVYARVGHQAAQCYTCGTSHDVDRRREHMFHALENHLGSSLEVAQMVSALGVSVSDSTIRKWVERKKLRPAKHAPPKRPGGDERPLYRVGDVVAVAAGRNIYAA